MSHYRKCRVTVVEEIPDPQLSMKLSDREMQVLCMAGMMNKEIAKELGISDQTVKNHFEAIMDKLNASTRTEAVLVAIATGILRVEVRVNKSAKGMPTIPEKWKWSRRIPAITRFVTSIRSGKTKT